MVAEQHPERKDQLHQAVEKAKRHLEVLKPAVVNTFLDLDDKNAQKRLQNLLQETKQVNGDIVDASQPALWDRIISNCQALSKDLPAFADFVKNGNKSSALNLLTNISNRMETQAKLGKKIYYFL